MLYNETTPRKEVTIQGAIFSVIAPYAEGHVITAEEANALNQTLKENIANNFAPRVKKVKAEGGNIEALQAEIETYMSEYSFGHRRTSNAVSVDPVHKIAIRMALAAIKKALIKSGKVVTDYSAEQLKAIAEAQVEKNPKFLELASQEYSLKKAANADLLGEL